MRIFAQCEQVRTETDYDKGFVVDTTFVLFFLAIEFGRTIEVIAADTVLLFITLLMLLILPYYLLTDKKPHFSNWLLGRTLIVTFAILLGLMFKQTLGVVLPDTFRFLPMTLLVMTAMLSCYLQFYGFLKLRLAK
jgi:hypothetical protein